MVDVEQVREALFGGIHVGDHASGSGAAFGAVVEQDGFLDAGEGVEEFADGHVQAGVVGFASHEVGDGEGENAVEDVDVDFGVGPVVHGAERDDVGVFQLPDR